MNAKQAIETALKNPACYHLSREVVAGINAQKRFRFYQGVLSLDIDEQKAFFEDIRGNNLISDFAYILHNSDCTEDGEKVRDHVHFFFALSNDLTYSNWLKKTGFDCVVTIPSTKENKSRWLEYVTDHDGKHTYDSSEVVYSSEDFRRSFEGEPLQLKDFSNEKKIEMIRNEVQCVCNQFLGRYLPRSVVYDTLSFSPVLADVFNYPVLVRCFVDNAIEEHNRCVVDDRSIETCEKLIDFIRTGKLTRKADEMLMNYYFTGKLEQPHVCSLDDYDYQTFEESESYNPPAYENVDEALRAFAKMGVEIN